MNKKFSELFPRNSKEQPEASPEPNTRREFLRRVGWGAAGLALGGAAWNLLPSGAVFPFVV
jgi:ferric-dicitrate binding protein FerR (iron transport regulator)